MPRERTEIKANPRLFFIVTWSRWLNLESHFGLISFGCTNPQAKDQVVLWCNGLLAKVSESYLVTIRVVVQELRNSAIARIKKITEFWMVLDEIIWRKFYGLIKIFFNPILMIEKFCFPVLAISSTCLLDSKVNAQNIWTQQPRNIWIFTNLIYMNWLFLLWN